LNEVRS